MEEQQRIYETVFVLHPELTDEDVEASIGTIETVLRDKGAEIIRVERSGKRRLAYVVQKQRYGYYNLIHFRALPETPAELERVYRLNERVIRHLTIHFEKEEELTGFTRLGDDDARDEDRDERRRGPRRDAPRRPPAGARTEPSSAVSEAESDSDTTDQEQPATTAAASAAPEGHEEAAENVSERGTEGAG
jgi:small subunit ribosomal protein S6